MRWSSILVLFFLSAQVFAAEMSDDALIVFRPGILDTDITLRDFIVCINRSQTKVGVALGVTRHETSTDLLITARMKTSPAVFEFQKLSAGGKDILLLKRLVIGGEETATWSEINVIVAMICH